MIPALARDPTAQMLAAVAGGVALGLLAPHGAAAVAPLGALFVRAIALVMNPLMFCMLAASIARIGDGRRLRGTGARALLYFTVMSLLSLGAGLLAATLLQPGAGLHAAAAGMPAPDSGLAMPGAPGGPAGPLAWLRALATLALHVDNLMVLVAAVPAGLLLARGGARASAALAGIDRLAGLLMKVVRGLLTLAPLAVFGAMAYAVARSGLVALLPLLKFVLASYLACALFVLLVMGGAARLAGLSMVRLLAYLRDELWLVFFTSSSLAALPRLNEKLRRLGCAGPVVALVLPFGYTLNLAGTNLYVGMAVLFLAQAGHVTLHWPQLLAILLVCLVTTKGAVGVAGSGFATLAATLAALHQVPPEMLAMLLGVERLMKCRSLTNVIGNAVACAVVAAWQHDLDHVAMAEQLRAPAPRATLESVGSS